MRVFRWSTRDNSSLAWWIIALATVAATAAIFTWLPRWVAPMRGFSLAGGGAAVVWLWAPACQRWLTRHWGRMQ